MNIEKWMNEGIDFIMTFGPKLVGAILIWLVGSWIIRKVTKTSRKVFQKSKYDKSLQKFLLNLLGWGLKIILIIMILGTLGVETTSFAAVLAAAGLAIGLALQGSLANFAGGVLILIFKPFKVGDWISAQGVDGSVKEITIFSTKLNTFGNQVAIIPNGQLSNGNVVNYNAEPTRRDNYTVGIGYSSNIKVAKDILLKICSDNSAVLKDPAPEVYVGALGDSSVNLSLRYWAKNEDFWAAKFYIHEESKLRFDEAGIEIPFPQRVIHSSPSS